jgi:signal transduction histidine kinase
MYVDQFIDPVDSGSTGFWQLSDADDRRLAGASGPPAPTAISRVIAGGGNVWTLRLWPDDTSPSIAGGRQRTLMAAMASWLLFVWGATDLMARAGRREADAARLQSDFVAAVSHEFRSPLTTMRQMAEMLDTNRVPGEPRRREYYRVLVSETARLQQLVETILNFGRMEAGAEPYQVGDVGVEELVESALADIRMLPGTAERQVQVDGPPEPVGLSGDRDALRLALRNLLDNAIKYSPADTPVRVRWSVDDSRVSIAVIDEGAGIPDSEKATIFHKFVRGHAARASRVAGTGVGLAIVQRIAAAHGGEVRLQSAAGRGSTFTLVLPIARRGVSDTNATTATNGPPMPAVSNSMKRA